MPASACAVWLTGGLVPVGATALCTSEDGGTANALADNPAASPEENLTARLKALETAAELDVLTDGWLERWRAEHAAANKDPP